ncbi:MAG: FAD:protein FMN transferase [Gammaproteobacteria bacterium]|nr:FAD:protein FMN transferase [Gammaproteobacteria bacterium]
MHFARQGQLYAARFRAMGSPCELLVDADDAGQFHDVAQRVEREVTRIECKYTRYGRSGVLALLRRRAGRRVWLDAETAGLLDVAALWHRRSDGLFDITGGALQRLWRFGTATAPPDPAAIARALQHTGFARLHWEAPRLELPPGIELDLGGLCKEYAVDRAHDILAARLDAPALVNLGGDLRVTGARRTGSWRIGLERGDGTRAGGRVVDVESGALATSGGARRHVELRGVRYGHILDPRTGWPVPRAPAAVSVAAPTCIEAGLLAKVALLHGAAAADYLADAGVRGWVAPAPGRHA